MESTLSVVGSKTLLTLFGACDQHVRRIRNALGVSITVHDGQIHVEGPEPAVAQATEVLEQLQTCANRQGDVSSDDVNRVLAGVQSGLPPTEHAHHRRLSSRPADSPAHPRPGGLRRGHPPERHRSVLRSGRHRQDLSGRGHGRRRPETAGDPQDRPGAAGGRGRRKPGLPARRFAGQDQSLSAAAAWTPCTR